MDHKFDFTNLFVLDMANNHQGDIEHGLNVIREAGAIVRKHQVKAALKFQFRQLDTFIHPAHRKETENKHVTRFLDTELKRHDYEKLLQEAQTQGMLSMCTPFDEDSVDVIRDMGFDILKVASCSATDWPLLEKVGDAGLPLVCSTGGLSLEQIDDLVSFFRHRGVEFALMYCVSIYPIPADAFHLNMIDIMRQRYPDVTIGWSTHENPDETVPVHIAVAKGAQMFERHIGLETDKIKLNAYSSTPKQLDKWIDAYGVANQICGGSDFREVDPAEKESLDSLRRGVYARKPIKKGTVLSRDQIYFAMPYTEGSLSSAEWRNGITVLSDMKTDAPILNTHIAPPPGAVSRMLKAARLDVNARLNEAKVALNSEFNVEYSHHYGIRNFREFGAVIIDCINREYCKKIIVQLPDQRHPAHFHKRKEETFQVLHGTLRANVGGVAKTLQPGETCLIQPGVWHSFWTDTGCVFEEVSTTHYNDDSFYADKEINRMERSDRKTRVDHWGRFEIEDAFGVAL